MKKSVLFLVLIMLCMLTTCTALGSETPENLITCEISDTGFLPGAAMTEDGMLLTGIPVDQGVPWVSLLDKSGTKKWTFSEAEKNVSQYVCPARLEDGAYTVLRQSYRDDAGYACDRLTLNNEGKLVRETPLWANTLWMIPDTEKTYSIGYYNDNGDLCPIVALQDSSGQDLFAYHYTVEGCASVVFEKGQRTQDALIISGQGTDTRFEHSAGLLYKIDLEGKVVWGLTSTADTPNEYVISNDFCVTGDGQIIWIFTTVQVDESDGYPLERSSTVYCLNRNGETVWTYQAPANHMLDYVVAVSGGFLFGSRGLDLEECPYLGQGWLLFLTRDGHEKPDIHLPLLDDGSLELLGITPGMEDSALCYGLLLQSPGYPDKPFWVELAFPHTDE